MENKISDKIEEIERYLDELEAILPSNFNNYENNFEKKAACERYFEKIIEAVVDLAFLIVKDKGFRIPEEDKGAFDILASKGVIPKELAKKLRDAKGMRNILAHEYGEIDDKIVFGSVTEELEKDVKEFLESVREVIKK